MWQIGVRAAAVYLSVACWLSGLALSGISASAWAKSATEKSSAPKKNANQTAKSERIEHVVTLPVRRLKAVRSESQIALISDNGRFVITGGQLMDIWQGRLLTTLDEIQHAATHVDFKKLGLNIDTLNTLTLGSGDQTVVAFIDPRSSPSRDLVKAAQPLAKTYTFQFVIVPALGEASHQWAKAVACTKNKRTALKALLGNTLEQLSVPKDCAQTALHAYAQTLLLAQLIPIEGVPTLIAPDGRIQRGLPSNLKAWLERPA